MNLPVDFIERMKKMLGEEYEAFARAFSENDNYIGMRLTKSSDISDKLKGYEPVPWCRQGFYADKSVISGKHPYHICGLVYFQEPSAMAPVEALPVNRGDYILDLCAAPGGKSTQAAQKLGGNGLLVANEIIPKRAEILAENIERCGIKNAVVTNESPEKLSLKYPEFFDKIIVDAPCSGEGMFRKEPRAIAEWSIAHTISCGKRQQHILDCAFKMLRPGGYLVYSTCTFAPEENEQNVEYVLSQYPDVSLVPIELEGLSDGKTQWASGKYDMSFSKRIFPHNAKGEGHFMALFVKDGFSKQRTKLSKCFPPPREFSQFWESTFEGEPSGNFFLHGDHLYSLEYDINLDKIKTIRAGLYMGIVKKGRFEPSHALALAADKEIFKNTINLDTESRELSEYLHGDVISCGKKGWVCVLADGYPIGWGKASGGILKNHFPKKYRLL